MACCDTSLPTLLHGIRCHDLCEARMGIIGFITMAVDIAVELFGKSKGIMDIFDAHVARPFVMWNTSNEIAAQFHGLSH